ncbi:MAG: growth inhibitor PemK [Parvularcula sp.]|nr:growth inhibitor PemK [Parvularcula sp.]
MSLPDPVPGLVIRHAFLWSHEAARGQSEAAKTRPCAIVVAAAQGENGALRVTVAPITHSPPEDETTCVELPAEIARELGFDDDRQWLRFDELNYFDWPGFDLSPVPGESGRYDYGMLPRRFFETAKALILARIRAGKRTSIVNRNV